MKPITESLLRKTAKAYQVEIRRRGVGWEMFRNHGPYREWMWMGDSVNQAAQDMADLLVADRKIETLLRRVGLTLPNL